MATSEVPTALGSAIPVANISRGTIRGTIRKRPQTHAHADHLSGAPYLKLKTGAKVGIGEHIRDVQKIFRPVFNATDLSGDGSEFDRLFKDGERFPIGTLEVQVLHVPGHTPADIAYKIGDTVFRRRHAVHAGLRHRASGFPGGRCA
jgi:hypothetical protein